MFDDSNHVSKLPDAHLRETVWNVYGSIPKASVVKYYLTGYLNHPYGKWDRPNDAKQTATIYCTSRNITIQGVPMNKLFVPETTSELKYF